LRSFLEGFEKVEEAYEIGSFKIYQCWISVEQTRPVLNRFQDCSIKLIASA
jgi:hypothetical protein